MLIKATIVAYVFSVQYFENAATVAYKGLRVKWIHSSLPYQIWDEYYGSVGQLATFKTVIILLALSSFAINTQWYNLKWIKMYLQQTKNLEFNKEKNSATKSKEIATYIANAWSDVIDKESCLLW